MTPELRKYYEDRFSMFATKGWADLMEDVQEMVKATNKIDGIDDLRKLGLRQGEVSIMNWLLSLKQVSEEAYEELIADEKTA